MPTRVVLIRHAQSENMVKGTVGGPVGDTGLTDLGRAQARALRDRLFRKPLRVEGIFSSPLRRALETVEIVRPALGDLEVVAHDGLGYHWPEHSDGLTWEEHRRRFAVSGGGIFRPYEAGEESWAAFVTRVGAILAEISCCFAGRSAVVFTHEEMIDTTFRVFGDLSLRGPFTVSVTPTSLTEWTTQDDPLGGGPPEWKLPQWRLERFNDAAHLEPLAETTV